MQLVKKPLSELKPYDNNPRYNDVAVDDVAESIKQCTYSAPIIVDENGVILAGHTRLKALQRLGYDEVEVIVQDGLTDEQKRKFRLLDNKTAEKAEWDFDILEKELEGLDFEGFDFGFDLDMDEESEAEAVEDDYDAEPPAEPKSKLGDIYMLGRHRLMCGDSTKAEDVERLMDGQKADLLLTDPPYGINYGNLLKGKGDGHGGADKNGWKSYGAPDWDKTRPQKDVFEKLIKCSRNQIIWGGNYFTDYLPPKMCWLCWDKGQRDFSLADGELAWTSFEKAMRIKTYSRAEANKEDKVHPTQKPIEVIKWCIDVADRNMGKAQKVLDTFGGSGSTLIACEQLDRTCYMMELSPQYIDVIIDRWEKFTGQKAVKIS